MTTLAAMLGALPMLLGTGTGSELRRPLGLAIIGGLAGEPDADAVHHAGHLSVLRPPVAQRFGAKARERAPGGCAREHSGALHQAAGRDHAAGRRASGFGHCWPISALPVAPLPNVDLSGRSSVQANMAGASPEIMASTVAEPLERRLATIAGVNELTSTSTVGRPRVVISSV